MSMSGSEVQWAVQVELSFVRVTTDDKSNAFVTYSFKFRIGSEVHEFTSRYSRLLKFHEKLTRSGILDRAFDFNPPAFPPKTWLKDMTKPKNYEKRASQLLEYFQYLVSKPIILKDAMFQKEIQLPKHLQKQMSEIAMDLQNRQKVIAKWGQSPSLHNHYKSKLSSKSGKHGHHHGGHHHGHHHHSHHKHDANDSSNHNNNNNNNATTSMGIGIDPTNKSSHSLHRNNHHSSSKLNGTNLGSNTSDKNITLIDNNNNNNNNINDNMSQQPGAMSPGKLNSSNNNNNNNNDNCSNQKNNENALLTNGKINNNEKLTNGHIMSNNNNKNNNMNNNDMMNGMIEGLLINNKTGNGSSNDLGNIDDSINYFKSNNNNNMNEQLSHGCKILRLIETKHKYGVYSPTKGDIIFPKQQFGNIQTKDLTFNSNDLDQALEELQEQTQNEFLDIADFEESSEDGQYEELYHNTLHNLNIFNIEDILANDNYNLTKNDKLGKDVTKDDNLFAKQLTHLSNMMFTSNERINGKFLSEVEDISYDIRDALLEDCDIGVTNDVIHKLETDQNAWV